MNVLVIGCGMLGRKIAQTLDRMGWDVSAMDARESELELLSESFGGVTFRGYPMDLRDLRQAGIESCDAVAVTTADDNLNIAVAQIARDYFGISNVVARVSDPARESIFENLGLRTVCPTNLAGDTIVNVLTGERASARLEFGLHTVSFLVRPAEKHQLGKTLWELHGYAGEEIFGVIRENGTFLLRSTEEIRLHAGDSIVYAKKVD
ncbi:MAG: TrkA family potassium uptake protein [Ruminococcus bromii]|nr:TrkA family potassium uptake protein [Ruminococcus bromii]